MSLKNLITILIVSSLFFFYSYNLALANNVCFNLDEAKQILVEIKENREHKELIKEQEELIINLKEQVKLLQEQVILLREIEQIRQNQIEAYKLALEEEKRKKRFSFLEKSKYFGIGILSGIVASLFLF